MRRRSLEFGRAYEGVMARRLMMMMMMMMRGGGEDSENHGSGGTQNEKGKFIS